LDLIRWDCRGSTVGERPQGDCPWYAKRSFARELSGDVNLDGSAWLRSAGTETRCALSSLERCRNAHGVARDWKSPAHWL